LGGKNESQPASFAGRPQVSTEGAFEPIDDPCARIHARAPNSAEDGRLGCAAKAMQDVLHFAAFCAFFASFWRAFAAKSARSERIAARFSEWFY